MLRFDSPSPCRGVHSAFLVYADHLVQRPGALPRTPGVPAPGFLTAAVPNGVVRRENLHLHQELIHRGDIRPGPAAMRIGSGRLSPGTQGVQGQKDRSGDVSGHHDGFRRGDFHSPLPGAERHSPSGHQPSQLLRGDGAAPGGMDVFHRSSRGVYEGHTQGTRGMRPYGRRGGFSDPEKDSGALESPGPWIDNDFRVYHDLGSVPAAPHRFLREEPPHSAGGADHAGE